MRFSTASAAKQERPVPESQDPAGSRINMVHKSGTPHVGMDTSGAGPEQSRRVPRSAAPTNLSAPKNLDRDRRLNNRSRDAASSRPPQGDTNGGVANELTN